jgi:hypothetical protein
MDLFDAAGRHFCRMGREIAAKKNRITASE